MRYEPTLIAELTVAGWRDFVHEKIAFGWKSYFLTFMFEPLPGGEARRMERMTAFIEDAYKIFVTRVVRNPRSIASEHKLPIWLCSPDLPVFKAKKADKASLQDVNINEGLHYHAILLLPHASRLDDVARHFRDLRETYNVIAALDRVDIEPISHFENDPIGYVQKQSIKGHFSIGDNFALPRSKSELPARRHWQASMARVAGEHRRPRTLTAIQR